MPDDIFKAKSDDWRVPGDTSTADRFFKDQPRLVPLFSTWLAILVMPLMAGMSLAMTGARLDEAHDTGGAWRAAMVLITLTPWALYALLPIVQRRHSTRPEPFYRYCRWVSIVTASVVPVLLVAMWAVGPGSVWGRGVPVLFIMVMYSLVMGLFPQAARRNHAAWLRARNAPPPY